MYGFRRGWYSCKWQNVFPSDYEFIGPWRWGRGPFAFHRYPTGRMVHSWGAYRWGVPASYIEEDLRAELDALKKEKTMLETRIEEIEKLLKEEK
jgi:hypothetical protein